MGDLETLLQYFTLACPPGGLLVFQVPPARYESVNAALRKLMPTLSNRNIGILLFDEDASIVMVPEARRVIALPKAI